MGGSAAHPTEQVLAITEFFLEGPGPHMPASFWARSLSKCFPRVSDVPGTGYPAAKVDTGPGFQQFLL